MFQAAELGCLQVRFTGGEPLLRRDFRELYLCARKLGMKVLLFTNARLVTPRIARLFAQIPPLVPIEITVYGMKAESYEAVTRVPGSFAQFWRGVSLLLEQRVPFIVKQALLPQNRQEIEQFESWAGTIPWMQKAPSYVMNFDLRGRRDNPDKNAGIQRLRSSPEEVVFILTRDKESSFQQMDDFRAKKFMGQAGRSLFQCSASSGCSGCLDAYGRLQPCMGIRIPELTVDLVGTGITLGEALRGFASMGEICASNPEYLRRCAKCVLKGLCEQCPAKSWSENGTLDTPVEYLCEVAHAQARFIGWLAEKQHGWEVIG